MLTAHHVNAFLVIATCAVSSSPVRRLAARARRHSARAPARACPDTDRGAGRPRSPALRPSSCRRPPALRLRLVCPARGAFALALSNTQLSQARPATTSRASISRPTRSGRRSRSVEGLRESPQAAVRSGSRTGSTAPSRGSIRPSTARWVSGSRWATGRSGLRTASARSGSRTRSTERCRASTPRAAR